MGVFSFYFFSHVIVYNLTIVTVIFTLVAGKSTAHPKGSLVLIVQLTLEELSIPSFLHVMQLISNDSFYARSLLNFKLHPL